MEIWHGYQAEKFKFLDRDAIIVFPKEKKAGVPFALKTEYWGAFPHVELALLERGIPLAWVQNTSRFATKEDSDVKAQFVAYLSKTYHLLEKCIPIGMSCGGAHAINFAGDYPHLIHRIFIDAPVLNFMSFPAKPAFEKIWEQEFKKAYPGIGRHQLLNFERHPINKAPILLEKKIPIIMVWGTEDQTVPYEENGALLEEAFAGSDLLKVIKVYCRGHHPHGLLGDQSEIVDFLLEALE